MSVDNWYANVLCSVQVEIMQLKMGREGREKEESRKSTWIVG